MFTIEMLPATRGDCLWLEYGGEDSPNIVVVDGGVDGEALLHKAQEASWKGCRIELLIVTHIDLDHIGGVVRLFRSPSELIEIKDIWFNGWKHLPDDPGLLGSMQAESLTTLIERSGCRWNKAFQGAAAATSHESECLLPQMSMDGGLRLTLLSPTVNRLRRLRATWKLEIERAGLTPGRAGLVLEEPAHPEDLADEGLLGGPSTDVESLLRQPFEKDRSCANGSSIAVLAEYQEKRILLAGDAFAEDLAVAVRLLAASRRQDKLQIDALKLAHHGGQKNTSPDLLSSLACRHFLFSTDGSYYGHPDSETVARVIHLGRESGRPQLHFNYFSDYNRCWQDSRLQRKHGFDAHFPGESANGLKLTL